MFFKKTSSVGRKKFNDRTFTQNGARALRKLLSTLQLKANSMLKVVGDMPIANTSR